MPLSDYAAFLPSLGWLAATMLTSLLPSLAGSPWRRHTGWLIAFCAGCLIAEATELAGVAPAREARAFGLVASGILLWEFARRCWNEGCERQLTCATHLVALECLALMAVASAVTTAGLRPAWFPLAALAFGSLPILLGVGASVLLHSSTTARGRRTAIAAPIALAGLAAYGIGANITAPPFLTALPPWIFAGALAVICFAEPATRTRSAMLCAGSLLTTAIVGPLILATTLQHLDDDMRDDLLTRADHAAAALQGRTAARLFAPTLPEETSRAVQQHLDRITLNDPLLRSARIWKLQDGAAAELEFGGNAPGVFRARGMATADERRNAQTRRPFVETRPAGHRATLVTVYAPLAPEMFASPAAWLALTYPDVFWVAQRQHVQRLGTGIIGIFAGFCAMGFVLASRQAIENAQRIIAERAQSANQAKTEFLAFLSHEMRTPLQTILGRTELLRATSNVTDDARRHAAAIETQGRLLLRLVTDLLDLGTLEAGKFQLRSQPFSLRHAIAAAEDTIRANATAKQLTLACDVAPDVPDALIGDEARVRQLLGNILGNAVKYTTRGNVRLEIAPVAEPHAATSGATRIQFRVSDTGPGLPPAQIDQLFTLFTRLDAGDSFTREGTGVGLALVRKLCALMGGTVSAKNRPEGGAEFTLELPFQIDQAVHANAGGERAMASATAPRRVLVAEDNTAVREFLTEALRSLGHDVVAVNDGDAAQAAALSGEFHTAFLDVNLPQRDGIAITRAVRQRDARLRIIGCSAEAGDFVRNTALAAGMNEYLVKPVSLEELSRVLASREPTPAGPNIFAQLQSPATQVRARSVLQNEWPALREATLAALARGESGATQRCAHYLQSSALMLGDDTLLQLCRALAGAPQTPADQPARELLARIDAHLATAAAFSREPRNYAGITT